MELDFDWEVPGVCQSSASSCLQLLGDGQQPMECPEGNCGFVEDTPTVNLSSNHMNAPLCHLL
eukprot:scaffold4484_cov15-Tisochrysis_lutea.AAC.2